MTDEQLVATNEELVKQALAELGDIVRCHCDEAHISRGLHDPSCNCDTADALITVKKHIRKLTEQLEAARADAKEAEAYAQELAKERDEANEVIDKQGALLADAYGALLDWDEVLKDRADHECKAKLAKAEEERDEALNQLDSARHSVDVLEKRVTATDKLTNLVSIAKRVTSFEDTVQDLAECGCDRCTAHLDLRGALAEIEGIGKAFDDDAEGLREKLRWSEIEGEQK